MEKLTFESIREKGLLLFEYIRGSKLYNINTPESDEDHGGVFIAPNSQLLGLGMFSEKNHLLEDGINYQEEVSDEKHDTTWWELGKFMNLAISSNPTVLEALFVPQDKVIYEHPLFAELRKHRDEFVTKACFKPFGGYAVSQIKKAQGQNKKIHWDMENMKRKTPLDFCHTFDGKQGAVNIQDWLKERGLRQDCCGLVNLPNMKGDYLLYYDYGQHIKLENITYKMFCAGINDKENDDKFFIKMKELRGDGNNKPLWDKISTPLGDHCGIIKQDGSSNTIRLCSTQKGEEPLCIINYNQDGYESHCRKYKEYEEWKDKRNKVRYESNLKAEMSEDPDMKYDCKNMAHCFRLVQMCIEIANGEGVKLDRTDIDREFLMDIRARKFKYSELMEKLESLKAEMDTACEKTQIKDDIDQQMVNDMLLKIRKDFERDDDGFSNIFADDDEQLDTTHEQKMLDDLKGLMRKVCIHPDDVMLTGSLALKMQGLLPEGREVHDLDIVIKGDKNVDKTFEVITRLNGGSDFFEQYEGNLEGISHKPFIFNYNGTLLNVWIQDPGVEFDTKLMYDGFWMATAKHIIDVKKYYKRGKDYKDINDIASSILDFNK